MDPTQLYTTFMASDVLLNMHKGITAYYDYVWGGEDNDNKYHTNVEQKDFGSPWHMRRVINATMDASVSTSP